MVNLSICTCIHAYFYSYITGDVALVKLGMNEDDYAYFCTDIDFVIHAAANVNLVYPYSVRTFVLFN